jgi:hypothetical protein
MWVAVGDPPSIIAYSSNGTTWNTATGIPFTTGWGVAWNGSMWVAVGDSSSGTNAIGYSYNGINWYSAATNSFIIASCVAWNGTMWIAGGSGTISMAYSYNGINWISVTNPISGTNGINGIAYNSARPNTITFTPSGTTPGITGGIVTTPISLNPGDVLDVVSDKYYNQGFSNFSLTVNYT